MTDDKTKTQLNHYSWNFLVNFISQNPDIIKIINFKERKCINKADEMALMTNIHPTKTFNKTQKLPLPLTICVAYEKTVTSQVKSS